jgi:hypothetical protein
MLFGEIAAAYCTDDNKNMLFEKMANLSPQIANSYTCALAERNSCK